MENSHPNAEQLSCYMDSPESSEHKDIRSHLMACRDCRSRVDRLAQLELDIRHYAPRFAHLTNLNDDSKQTIQRYTEGQLDPELDSRIAQRIHNDRDSMKSALHYAVHSATMSKNIDTMNSQLASPLPVKTSGDKGATGGFFAHLTQRLQWHAPAWVIAPASLAFAALFSYVLLGSLPEAVEEQPRIAAFQDNTTIAFRQTGMPAGSIGFFHDAQSRSEPFSGISIKLSANNTLDLQWQPITDALEYTVDIYINSNGERTLVSTQTSATPRVSFGNMDLLDGKHYQWQLSGKIREGLQFQTSGDFVYYKGNNS